MVTTDVWPDISLCVGIEWVLPQCVWTGPSVELLQGLLCGGWDVFGGGDPWDQPEQSASPTSIS